jgi:hypothetical protein
MSFSVDGDDQAQSSLSDGVVTTTGHAGLRITISGFVVEVLAVADSAAVLRLTRA